MLCSIYYAAHPVQDSSEDEYKATQRICNTAWKVCGQHVSLSNFTYLLGTTECTVWKLIYGIQQQSQCPQIPAPHAKVLGSRRAVTQKMLMQLA
jgi:hypothetical protein